MSDWDDYDDDSLHSSGGASSVVSSYNDHTAADEDSVDEYVPSPDEWEPHHAAAESESGDDHNDHDHHHTADYGDHTVDNDSEVDDSIAHSHGLVHIDEVDGHPSSNPAPYRRYRDHTPVHAHREIIYGASDSEDEVDVRNRELNDVLDSTGAVVWSHDRWGVEVDNMDPNGNDAFAWNHNDRWGIEVSDLAGSDQDDIRLGPVDVDAEADLSDADYNERARAAPRPRANPSYIAPPPNDSSSEEEDHSFAHYSPVTAPSRSAHSPHRRDAVQSQYTGTYSGGHTVRSDSRETTRSTHLRSFSSGRLTTLTKRGSTVTDTGSLHTEDSSVRNATRSSLHSSASGGRLATLTNRAKTFLASERTTGSTRSAHTQPTRSALPHSNARCVICKQLPAHPGRLTCDLECTEHLAIHGGDPSMCAYCHARPRHRRWDVHCGKECSESAKVACLFCKCRPRRGQYHLCGETCRVLAERRTPLLLEAPMGHATYQMVESKFKAAWKAGTPCPEIKRVFKIVENEAFLRPYENHLRKRGNEHFRYHGTGRSCQLGQCSDQTQVCNSRSCSVCSILKTSFKVNLAKTSGAFGAGIYTSSASNKAFSYCGSGGSMLLTKVVMGNIKYVTSWNEVMSRPKGYDSVVFDRQGGTLNETVVYSDDAIRPVFLITF